MMLKAMKRKRNRNEYDNYSMSNKGSISDTSDDLLDNSSSSDNMTNAKVVDAENLSASPSTTVIYQEQEISSSKDVIFSGASGNYIHQGADVSESIEEKKEIKENSSDSEKKEDIRRPLFKMQKRRNTNKTSSRKPLKPHLFQTSDSYYLDLLGDEKNRKELFVLLMGAAVDGIIPVQMTKTNLGSGNARCDPTCFKYGFLLPSTLNNEIDPYQPSTIEVIGNGRSIQFSINDFIEQFIIGTDSRSNQPPDLKVKCKSVTYLSIKRIKQFLTEKKIQTPKPPSKLSLLSRHKRAPSQRAESFLVSNEYNKTPELIEIDTSRESNNNESIPSKKIDSIRAEYKNEKVDQESKNFDIISNEMSQTQYFWNSISMVFMSQDSIDEENEGNIIDFTIKASSTNSSVDQIKAELSTSSSKASDKIILAGNDQSLLCCRVIESRVEPNVTCNVEVLSDVSKLFIESNEPSTNTQTQSDIMLRQMQLKYINHANDWFLDGIPQRKIHLFDRDGMASQIGSLSSTSSDPDDFDNLSKSIKSFDQTAKLLKNLGHIPKDEALYQRNERIPYQTRKQTLDDALDFVQQVAESSRTDATAEERDYYYGLLVAKSASFLLRR